MKLKYNFTINQIGDDFIAVPVSTEKIDFNGILRLNETAAFIVDTLNNDITEDVLIATVAEKFSCEKQDAEQNIATIVNSLREAELILE